MKEIKQKLKRWLIEFLARRIPACDYMTGIFSDALERPLTLREKITAKLHLFTCDACQRYVKQIEFMHENLQSKDETDVPEKPSAMLSTDARERIKATLQTAVKKR